MTLQQLFSKHDSWVQGNYAITKTGKVCDPHSRSATCFCLSGAIHRCYPQTYDIIKHKLATVMERKGYDLSSITVWNDDPKRTINDIRQLIKEANV